MVLFKKSGGNEIFIIFYFHVFLPPTIGGGMKKSPLPCTLISFSIQIFKVISNVCRLLQSGLVLKKNRKNGV